MKVSEQQVLLNIFYLIVYSSEEKYSIENLSDILR